MTMHTIWYLAVVIIMIGVTALRPTERSFIPGLVLIGVGLVGKLLRELVIIPRQFWLEARIVYVGVAILGLVLMERAWARRKTSSSSRRTQ
jgi:hypothetical protein